MMSEQKSWLSSKISHLSQKKISIAVSIGALIAGGAYALISNLQKNKKKKGTNNQQPNLRIFTEKSELNGFNDDAFNEDFLAMERNSIRQKLIDWCHREVENHRKSKNQWGKWAQNATIDSIKASIKLDSALFKKNNKKLEYMKYTVDFGFIKHNTVVIKSIQDDQYVETMCSCYNENIDITTGKCAEEILKEHKIKLEKTDLPNLVLD